MSFLKSLKGLADDFKGMMSDKDDEKKKQDKPAAPIENVNHDRSYSGYPDRNTQQQGYYNNNNQQPYPPQQQYQNQQQYSQPPPQPNQGYNTGAPALPPGWIQQWDHNSQRPYYLEQATGRTQWEPPQMQHDRGFGGPPPSGQGYPYHQQQQQGYPPGQEYGNGYDQGYGYGMPGAGGLSHPGGQNYPIEAVRAGETTKKKSGSNKGAMLAAGAGGLALGGLAGAALAGDSSDDEHHAAPPSAGYATQPDYSGGGGYGYGAPPPGAGPPMEDPQALENNSDVSSSQRSSLEEARHEYETAQREAADSDASSSDREEAEEAREEYEEEIEEAREDAED